MSLRVSVPTYASAWSYGLDLADKVGKQNIVWDDGPFKTSWRLNFSTFWAFKLRDFAVQYIFSSPAAKKSATLHKVYDV